MNDAPTTEPKRASFIQGLVLTMMLHALNVGVSYAAGVSWVQIVGLTQFAYVALILIVALVLKLGGGFVKGCLAASALLLVGNAVWFFLALSKTGVAH